MSTIMVFQNRYIPSYDKNATVSSALVKFFAINKKLSIMTTLVESFYFSDGKPSSFYFRLSTFMKTEMYCVAINVTIYTRQQKLFCSHE